MDEIRIYLGNEDVLKERCEYLAEEGSGLQEGETLIDCEKFGISIGVESGSGDEEFIPTGTNNYVNLDMTLFIYKVKQ